MVTVARSPLYPNTLVVAPRGSKYEADYYYDGVSDNEEVQRAINTLPDAGGTVLILGSRLNFSDSVVIDRSNLSIIGDGIGVTVVRLDDSTEANLFKLTPTANRENIKIVGLTVDGNKDNQAEPESDDALCGVYVSDTSYTISDLVFDNVEVKETYSGSGIRTKNVNGLKITNCKIHDNDGYGLDFQDTTNLIMTLNKFASNALGNYNEEAGGISIIHDNVGLSQMEGSTPVNAVAASGVLTSDNTNVSSDDEVVAGEETYVFKTALTEAKATATLTSDTTAPSDGDQVVIGNKTYTYKTSLTGAANEVLIGADAAAALDNLKSAVNGSAGAGSTYGTGTVAHTQVDATTNTDTTQLFVAKAIGVAGNAYASTETSSHLSFGGATFSGGADAVANEVLIGSDADDSLTNLKLAINAGSGEGTKYGTGTVANADLSSGNVSSHTITLTAAVKGVSGNLLATTTTAAHLSFGDETLADGVDGTVGIKNEVVADSNYLYIATADNSISGTNWKRIPLDMIVTSSTLLVIAPEGSTSEADYYTDGVDDDVQIQSALDALNVLGGGLLYIKAGTYSLTSAVNVYSDTKIYGDGARGTILQQMTDDEHGIYGTGSIRHITIEDLQVLGTGSGSGNGVYIGDGPSASTPQPHLVFKSVYVKNFGNDGFHLSFTFNSTLENCRAESCGNFGFDIGKDGNFLSDGVTMTSCFASGNTNLGYYLRAGYSSFISCLAEYSGMGFCIRSSDISLMSCAVENINSVDATYNGTGFYVDDSNNVVLNGCPVYDNDAVAFLVDGTSNHIGFYNCNEYSVDSTETASFKTMTGVTALFIGCKYITAYSLAAGTATWIDATELTTPGATTIKSSSATSLAVGPNGTTNPVLSVDSSQGSQQVGLKVTGNASGFGVVLQVISGTTNENLRVQAKGTGKPVLQYNTAPAAGGSSAASVGLSSTANLGIYFGSGAPTVSAAQGSLYIRTDGSSISTRLYVNTDGGTTWTNVTTAA